MILLWVDSKRWNMCESVEQAYEYASELKLKPEEYEVLIPLQDIHKYIKQEPVIIRRVSEDTNPDWFDY